MKKLLSILVLLIVALAAPHADATPNLDPPGSFCSLYAGIDSFPEPPMNVPAWGWRPWTAIVSGSGSVSYGYVSTPSGADWAVTLRQNASDAPGNWVAIDKDLHAQSSETPLVQTCDPVHFWPYPNPYTAPSKWCTVSADVRPAILGVTNAALEVFDANYNLLDRVPFTRSKGAPFSTVQSAFISNCPKDLIVRIAVAGKYDWLTVGSVWSVWYYDP